MQRIKRNMRAFLSKPHNDYILIGAMVGIISIANLVWIFSEGRPPHWDMARHLWNSLNYLELFQQHNLDSMLSAYHYYPPSIYFVALPFYILFGASIPTAVFSNVIFIAIGAFSMYALGEELWNRRTGLLAVLFLLCSPMLVTQFKEFQIDAPLTALTALTLYLIVRSREFVSTKFSILLGISLGLGLLTKWTYGFIIAAPLGLAILSSLLLTFREKAWRRLGNVVACLVSAYTVASVWYITNIKQLKFDLALNGVGAGAREGDPVVGSLASNIWYGWNLISNQLYLIPSLFLLVGLVYLFTKKKHIWANRYPLVLVIGVLLFFTLLRNKDARYTLPAMVGISVLATYWITQLKQKTQIAISIGLIAYLMVMFYVISFGIRWLPSQIRLTGGTYPITGFAQRGYLIGPPSDENWHLSNVFARIGKLPASQRYVYYSGTDTIWFNNWDLTYYTKLNSATLVTSPDKATVILTRTEADTLSKELPRGEVFLLPDGGKLIYEEKN